MKEQKDLAFSEILQRYYVENMGILTKDQLLLSDHQSYRMKLAKAGTKLVVAGSYARHILLVVTGEFYIKRSSSMGKPNVLAKTAAPEFIGQMQLFTDDPYYRSDIYALKDCYYIEFDNKYFYNELKKSVDSCFLLMKSFAEIVSGNHFRMDRSAFHSTEENLLHEIYLSYLHERNKEEIYVYKESKSHLSDMLGVSERTVFRAIDKLKKNGVLDTNARGHIVISREQLHNFSKKMV